MDILKNMQELQGKMSEMQERLKDIVITGSSGGGMVSIRMNGKMEVLDVNIAPEAVDPRDVAMLEDLVQAAVNSTMRDLQEELKSQAANLAGGTGMPFGGNFPGL